MINAYSKLPEGHIVPSNSAQPTADKLRMIFATHGRLVILVLGKNPPR